MSRSNHSSHLHTARSRRRVLVTLSIPAVLLGTLTAISSPAGASNAVTLYVNGSLGTVVSGCSSPGANACETLQQAITAAESYTNSDVTILVAAGTYNEHDTINVPSTDTLVIQGAGAPVTTINANNSGSVVMINAGIATLSGLTISGGNASNGAGIYSNGTTTIENDSISNNSTGSAIYIVGGTTSILKNDTIANNVGSANGGAAYIANTANATFENDTIFNDSGGLYGTGIYNNGTANLTNDTLFNSPGTYGYGLTTSGGVTTNGVSI